MKQCAPGSRHTMLRCLAGAWAFVLLAPAFVMIAFLEGILHPRRASGAPPARRLGRRRP